MWSEKDGGGVGMARSGLDESVWVWAGGVGGGFRTPRSCGAGRRSPRLRGGGPQERLWVGVLGLEEGFTPSDHVV